MKRVVLSQLLAAKAAREPVALVTNINNGEQRLIARGDAAFEQAFRFDQSAMVGDEFVAIHNPPLRLVIIGAVLIAQSLIPVAQSCGYDVTVIDPRGAFANVKRFPNVHVIADWSQDVLPGMNLDARTAFVALTHDPKIDDPALEIALRSEVFYVGALGSKKTQSARQERLSNAGFTSEDLTRICGPIGLNIGAVGAHEIAISIMAEMTKALRIGLA